MPLGVAGGDATDHEARLLPGAGLLLFTDGLVEHHTADLDDRLAELREICGGTPPGATLDDPRRIIDRALRLLDVPDRVDDDTALLAAVPWHGDCRRATPTHR
jgi:hypothetical protein